MGKVLVKVWTDDIEPMAAQQLQNLSQLPIIHHHLAAMPDVHWGIGATVGAVIPCKKAVIPAAVGVDLGCGMIACQLNITAKDLPDNLYAVRSAIESAVPHGRTHRGGKGDQGAWRRIPDKVLTLWKQIGLHQIKHIVEAHPLLFKNHVNAIEHLGTLGTGNHFIEMCLDENGQVWLMLHSGSRGIGNRIGSYFIELAKKDMQRHIHHLPDKDLAYFTEGNHHFNDYVTAVHWAQEFALHNRTIMMEHTLAAVKKALGREDLIITQQAINCHHNYVEKETHFGEQVWVTRKGAIRAKQNELGIIPGSMGTKSYIVKGKGNPESFHSCSHGAGRRMSRAEAKRRFNQQDLIKQTNSVECRKDNAVIDEIPAAYKDIDVIMHNQFDLVEIIHTLKQVVCVKG